MLHRTTDVAVQSLFTLERLTGRLSRRNTLLLQEYFYIPRVRPRESAFTCKSPSRVGKEPFSRRVFRAPCGQPPRYQGAMKKQILIRLGHTEIGKRRGLGAIGWMR